MVKRRKKYFETSKKLAYGSLAMYIIISAIILLLSVKGYDVSPYATQLIITTGGICGASVIAYFIKSNRENIIRDKRELIKWEYQFKRRYQMQIKENPEETFEKDINDIKESIEGKLDNDVTEAINKDPEIPIF